MTGPRVTKLKHTRDGRVKIPVSFADYMVNPHTGEAYHRSHLTRVNSGERPLGLDAALQVIHLFRLHGHEVGILEIVPSLAKLIPYLCPEKNQKNPKKSGKGKK